MKNYISLAFLAAFFVSVSCVDTYRHPLEDELERLDAELARMDEYLNEKETRITMSRTVSSIHSHASGMRIR